MERTVDEVICVSSNADLEIFKNSHTRFANKTPLPIKSKVIGRPLFIKILGIVYSTLLDNDYPIEVNCLKIHLEEVIEQWQDSSYCRVVATIPYKGSHGQSMLNDTYKYFQIPHTPFLPIAEPTLSQLNLRLSDEYLFNLTFHPTSPPTHVFFRVTDMPDSNEFTVSCSSYHPQFFPANTLNHFTSPLPREITLDQFEVSLLSFVMPPNMQERERWASFTVKMRGEEDVLRSFNMTNYTTLEDFIDDVNMVIGRIDFLKDVLKFIKILGTQHHGKLAFQYFPHRPEPSEEEEEEEEELVPTADGGVRIEKKKKIQRKLPKILHITVMNYFGRICGEESSSKKKIRLLPGQQHIFGGQPSIYNARPGPAVMLQADLIEQNILGGNNANFLACIPIDPANPNLNSNRVYEPQQLSFHPIVRCPLNTITFTLTDSIGQKREFYTAEEKKPLLITLLFRQKKKLGK